MFPRSLNSLVATRLERQGTEEGFRNRVINGGQILNIPYLQICMSSNIVEIMLKAVVAQFGSGVLVSITGKSMLMVRDFRAVTWKAWP